MLAQKKHFHRVSIPVFDFIRSGHIINVHSNLVCNMWGELR